MNITTILIIVNVFAALTMIVLTLMQQSKGDMGSAFGGGGSQSMFGSRGSANFLSRATSIMCIVFFVSSLTLAYIYSKRAVDNSVIDSGSVIQETNEVPSIDDNSVPVVDAPDSADTDNSIPEISETVDGVNAQESTQETNAEENVDQINTELESVIESIEAGTSDAADAVEESPELPAQ